MDRDSPGLESRHPKATGFGALGVALVLAGVVGIGLVVVGIVAPEHISLVFGAVTLVAMIPVRAVLDWKERQARARLARLQRNE